MLILEVATTHWSTGLSLPLGPVGGLWHSHYSWSVGHFYAAGFQLACPAHVLLITYHKFKLSNEKIKQLLKTWEDFPSFCHDCTKCKKGMLIRRKYWTNHDFVQQQMMQLPFPQPGPKQESSSLQWAIGVIATHDSSTVAVLLAPPEWNKHDQNNNHSSSCMPVKSWILLWNHVLKFTRYEFMNEFIWMNSYNDFIWMNLYGWIYEWIDERNQEWIHEWIYHSRYLRIQPGKMSVIWIQISEIIQSAYINAASMISCI